MHTDKIEYKGCTINVHLDECAENPFKAFDCEPPIAVFYDRQITRYGDAPDIRDLVALIPKEKWARGKRLEIIRELNVSLREFAEYRRENGESVEDAFASLALEQAPEPDNSWREAGEHFEMLEWLCKLAGVACYSGESDGHSQGDSALVIAFATPAWAKLVGAPVETLERQCEAAFDLYTAWAWGDVYGYTATDENGDEIEDASVWGFYGSDHKESGLLESAQEQIDWHLKDRQAKADSILAAVSAE